MKRHRHELRINFILQSYFRNTISENPWTFKNTYKYYLSWPVYFQLLIIRKHVSKERLDKELAQRSNREIIPDWTKWL